MKKIICLLLVMIMLTASVPAMAANLPGSFWPLNESYSAAVAAKDYPAIASSAGQIIDIVSQLPKDDQTVEIIGSRAYEAAFAYYFLGDYENSVKYFNIYLPCGLEKNWTDGVKIAKEFIKQLTPALEVYQYTDQPQWVYGAKNEPTGVLYGQVSEKMQPKESMVLLYLEYGNTSYFDWAHHILKQASNQGKTVELALNFPLEGTNARTISEGDSYLTELYSFLQKYPDVDVLLRIGAEMNIWGNAATPEEFIRAFRIISLKMKSLPNVAAVWSVAHTAGWNVDTNDYYPGDEYVDWVGVTVYSNKYFLGQRWNGTEVFNEVCFKTGYNADPVIMISDIVNTYGNRKPIMISECGSAYKTNGVINEYHHEWAAEHLKKIYSFIPMVYPQVKVISYFNKNISHEYNYYDLDGSMLLQSAYDEASKRPWFVSGDADNAAETYFKKADDVILTDGFFTLGAYPHIYGADTVKVDYYLDGALYASTREIPYKADFENITGTRSLKVVATGNNGAVMERNYTVVSTLQPEGADAFSDTAALSDAQKDAVSYAYENRIITGYEDNTFRPYNTITRAEFATMICRLMKYDANAPCSFDDAKDHWGSAYINACVKAGAINGVGNNMFAPDAEITFEQAVKIVSVVCGVATGKEEYPQGFIDKANAKNMLANLMTTEKGMVFNRIDAAVLMYNAVK
ncbi:MAG: S-layer homology domain-containing protein [Clostridia bacterium]|nr:S-layer homology domain-containing protein [Clostridia bacterium]